MTPPSAATLLAVDVGTLSARAGLFDAAGACLATATRPFPLLKPVEGQAVYRMDDIWAAVVAAIRECLGKVPAEARRVAAVAFDATSSTALTADGAAPLDGDADVICWMDHRAEAEAEEIGASGDRYLHYVGGSMSPELHLPKLLWLRRHRPEVWRRLTAVRDLCDELAFRLTGSDRHSLCGFAAKWPYLPNDAEPWRHGLLEKLGIADLLGRGEIGAPPLPVGALHGRVGAGAAAETGLAAGIPVAVGLIDAEAGALGVIGASYRDEMNAVLAMIGGTSTCYMAWAPDERRIPGVWGPFRDAVFPGFWMHEAGQSLSGAALDAVLDHHPASPGKASAERHAAASAEILALLDAEGPAFAARRHIVPDWLGNRSPLGDGSVRALLTGIGEETGPRAFLEHYYATARALALQSRHVLDHLNRHGYALTRVTLAGGHARNPLLLRLYRDALGADLVTSDTAEPVLLGTAMVAAVAGGLAPDLFAAVEQMAPRQQTHAADPAWRAAHERAYRTYLDLFEVRNRIEQDARAISANHPPSPPRAGTPGAA